MIAFPRATALAWCFVILLNGCGGGGDDGVPNTVAVGTTPPSGTSWGAALTVESNSADAEYSSIAADPNGNVIAVWQQGGTTQADVKQIFASHFSSSTGWGNRVPISVSGAMAPQIALCASGIFYAAWVSNTNVWISKYTPGIGWGTAQTAGIGAGPVSSTVYLVCDSQGYAHLAWSQWEGVSYSIYVNRYSEGSGMGVAAPVESDAGNASISALAADPLGQVVVVWEQSGGTIGTTGIRVARYMQGVGWSGPVTIPGTTSAMYSDLAMDSSGNAMLVWKAGNNLVASRYAGGGWEPPVSLESIAGEARLPAISFDTMGNALVVWEQFDGAFYSIYANRYAANGSWSGAQLIESNSGNSMSAQISFDAAGNAIATWVNQSVVWRPYANRFSSGAWGAATLIGNGIGSAYDPVAAFLPNGNVIAVWYQYDAAPASIWSNRTQ